MLQSLVLVSVEETELSFGVIDWRREAPAIEIRRSPILAGSSVDCVFSYVPMFITVCNYIFAGL